MDIILIRDSSCNLVVGYQGSGGGSNIIMGENITKKVQKIQYLHCDESVQNECGSIMYSNYSMYRS
eukprot:scaffold114294_cov69-Cyclotella_meneghiniana.AAC.6